MNRLGVPGTCVLVAGDGGLTQDSVALGFQLRAVDGQRLKKKLGHLSQESITAIAEAILVALGISLPGAPKLPSPRH
jgi:mRNA interferase MazF